MNMGEMLELAANGRPDLAAKNLGAGVENIRNPVRFLKILRKYPHSSGVRFSVRYLVACYKEGREEAGMQYD